MTASKRPEVQIGQVWSRISGPHRPHIRNYFRINSLHLDRKVANATFLDNGKTIDISLSLFKSGLRGTRYEELGYAPPQ